jgi:hypothetical protein
MGYSMHGRRLTHITEAITLKGVEIEIVAEGSFDFDEDYFDIDAVYLKEKRKKTNNFKLPKRICSYLTQVNCLHAENWDDLARENF